MGALPSVRPENPASLKKGWPRASGPALQSITTNLPRIGWAWVGKEQK